MKTCRKCHNIYALSDFYKLVIAPDGLRYECKICTAREARQRRLSRTDKQKQAAKEYQNNYKRTHPEMVRRSCLKRKYKITLEQYEQQLAQQGGGCAICGVLPDAIRVFHVDHDHSCCAVGKTSVKTCGKCIRGLLCSRCNNGLGQFGDDSLRLERAAQYLKDFNIRPIRENEY